MCRVPRLLLTFRGAGQYDVPGAQPALSETKQQPARTDLDVVGVRSDREDRERLAPWWLQVKWQHGQLTPPSARPSWPRPSVLGPRPSTGSVRGGTSPRAERAP